MNYGIKGKMYVIYVWRCQVYNDINNTSDNKNVNLFIIINIFIDDMWIYEDENQLKK